MRRYAVLSSLLALSFAPCANAITVDGNIDAAEWSGARHITDFKMVQPLTRAAAVQPVEAWVLSTPEGLAIAFKNTQPASVPRTRQKSQRDAGGPVDRVNVYVDFDGDSRSGYNFTVTLAGSITDGTIGNENQFNNDWDGDWQSAVSEDESTWSAELLIPWHIAPMQKVAGETRTLGLSLDRVIGASNERMAWPAVSFTETRFLSVLEKIEVPQQSQSLLAVTPYVVGVYDAVSGDGHFDGGADVFWKPSGQFQLSAALNPDFGQVESDALVVNFSAIETFVNDKRPFFTENQGYFDVPFGSLNNANRLIYTRRVGGPADDGNGSGDVTAAVKLNGSAAGFNYGVFAATEADAVGRDFFALRGSRDSEKQALGVMLTRVDRPYFDREATVLSFDHRWKPSTKLNISSAIVASTIDQAASNFDDSGAQVRIDHELGGQWRQSLYWLHLGKDLQLNDFGYLERNNFNYLRYEVSQRKNDLPESSKWASHQTRYAVSTRHNDQGVHLWDAYALNRFSERRDGGNMFWELAAFSSGFDDLVTRGHGVVKVPAKYFVFIERYSPRNDGGPWEFYGNFRYGGEGLHGFPKGSFKTYQEATYHVNDSLRYFAGLQAERNNDWLLWQHDEAQLGTFDARTLFLTVGSTWLINDKQELRLRLEAIGLDAEATQAWTLNADGRPLASNTALNDFAVRNLGFQIRYRYEFAPLSNLYIAYVRGGSMFMADRTGFDVGNEFVDAFSLRDSEQLLIKLSYRFAN